MIPRLLRRAIEKARERSRRARFAASLRHVHGPRQLDVDLGEVVLVALVRDGRYYLDAFFRHYRAMGIRHFVFFDNGSSDDTIARIRAEKGTVIDQSRLLLAQYEDLMRQHAAQTYGANRWCLYADMDEIFDFEGRSAIGIRGLVEYLTQSGYTALVAQMLEMFPKGPLRAAADLPYKQALQQFLYYDISYVQSLDYHSAEIPFSALLTDNIVSNPDIRFLFGGVRGKVFGEACCLTKHPLVFNGPGVTPAPHPHLSQGVVCADFTGVMRHYTFANDPVGRDRASLHAGRVDHGEDAKRLAGMADEDLTLFSLELRRWNRVEILYRAGFLQASAAYTAFVGAQG